MSFSNLWVCTIILLFDTLIYVCDTVFAIFDTERDQDLLQNCGLLVRCFVVLYFPTCRKE
jgi:hypothetical protein